MLTRNHVIIAGKHCIQIASHNNKTRCTDRRFTATRGWGYEQAERYVGGEVTKRVPSLQRNPQVSSKKRPGKKKKEKSSV
jgi:hypothetical protein